MKRLIPHLERNSLIVTSVCNNLQTAVGAGKMITRSRALVVDVYMGGKMLTVEFRLVSKITSHPTVCTLTTFSLEVVVFTRICSWDLMLKYRRYFLIIGRRSPTPPVVLVSMVTLRLGPCYVFSQKTTHATPWMTVPAWAPEQLGSISTISFPSSAELTNIEEKYSTAWFIVAD